MYSDGERVMGTSVVAVREEIANHTERQVIVVMPSWFTFVTIILCLSM